MPLYLDIFADATRVIEILLTLEAIPTRARLVRAGSRSLGSLIIPFGTSCWSLILTNNRGRASARISYERNGDASMGQSCEEGTGGLDGWRSCFSRNLPRQPTTFTLLAVATPAATRLAILRLLLPTTTLHPRSPLPPPGIRGVS